MMLSKDNKVRDTIKWFANDERDHRGIHVDPESNFLDWKDEHGSKGTATLTVRTRKAWKNLS
jgi:rubrerythrin